VIKPTHFETCISNDSVCLLLHNNAFMLKLLPLILLAWSWFHIGSFDHQHHSKTCMSNDSVCLLLHKALMLKLLQLILWLDHNFHIGSCKNVLATLSQYRVYQLIWSNLCQ
jgi:hypothetical protein